ncbi:thioredoxin domain-containing protein 17-like, partial [Saccoglossus kowalevskii]
LIIVVADPVIEKGLDVAPEGSVFILCIVGDQKAWNCADNAFKNLPDIAIPEIPMLMKLSTRQKLDNIECKNEELVKKFISG